MQYSSDLGVLFMHFLKFGMATKLAFLSSHHDTYICCTLDYIYDTVGFLCSNWGSGPASFTDQLSYPSLQTYNGHIHFHTQAISSGISNQLMLVFQVVSNVYIFCFDLCQKYTDLFKYFCNCFLVTHITCMTIYWENVQKVSLEYHR